MADIKNAPNENVQRGQQYNRPHRTGSINSEANNNDNDFARGLFGAEDKRDSAYQFQPTPFGVTQMMDEISQRQAATDGSSPFVSDPRMVDSPAASTQQAESTMPTAKINEETLRQGMEILRKYKKGKQQLEDRVVRNEKWWKIRHWDMIQNEANKDDPKPASGWLFNTIISKHADYMDSYPTSDILPREQGDMDEAQKLTSIIPVVMAQNNFKKVYSEVSWEKLKHGTGIYGVFWDQDKLNGLGDISIQKMDLLSIFWEPGVMDIQKSENLFTVELVSNHILQGQYPQIGDRLTKTTDTIIKKYWYDESIDTTGKSAVVDWYYHKTINGKRTLQYIKFVDDILLYATEEDPAYAQRGLYDHGKYPFVYDVLFPDVGMPTGFGFVDVCKNPQTSIDIYNNAFEKNVQYACSPRFFVRNDGGVNEEEFANPYNLLVHTDGNLGEDSLKAIETPTFINGNYINLLEQKINEMKECAGNRDATTGGTQSGVTAASAIAAMQESAGKTSRDQINATYEAHKEVVYLVIELIRQFYDMPRQFRIIGQEGQMQFTQYTNDGLQPQYQGMEYGQDMGFRLPMFDIDVKTEKESAYTQLSQNELALQFYNQGFFNPQYADQALACIDMMEFTGKQNLVSKIQENGTMYQTMLQMQQQMLQMGEMVDQLTQGQTNFADQIAAQAQQLIAQGSPNGSGAVSLDNGGGGIVENARERAQAATAPR